jgi:hypothetical protein
VILQLEKTFVFLLLSFAKIEKIIRKFLEKILQIKKDICIMGIAKKHMHKILKKLKIY